MVNLELIYDNDESVGDEILFNEKVIKNFLIEINYKNYFLHDVNNFIVNHEKKYLHIIFQHCSLSNYCKNKSKLPISTKVKNLIRENKNIFILFYFPTETDWEDVVSEVDLHIKKENLNPQQFYICNGNENLVGLKSKINSDVNVYTTNFLHCGHVKQITSFIQNIEINLNKKFLFSCHNRRVDSQSHRVVLSTTPSK